MAGEKGKNILVVDNEPHISNLLKFHLSEFGYNVQTAKSHSEVFKTIQKEKPDLITLDLMLSGEGIRIMKDLKEDPITKTIPIMVITIADNEETCIEHGAACFANKPFDGDKIAKSINEFWD